MDEQYEQQPMAYSPSEEKPDFSKWMLSNDDVVDEFEYKLRGWKLDRQEGKWYQPNPCFPLMNEKGIKVFITYLSTFTSRNIVLSNFRLEDVNARMEEIVKTVVSMVCDYYEDYAIKTHPDVMIDMVERTIEAMLRRPVGNEERKLLLGTNSIARNEMVSPQIQQQVGMFDFFRKKGE